MSEYWKSNAKHWCRFCKIYITDNKSTRNIHDSGTKHKENVERFLREQNQRGREKEAEAAKMNKQMEAIEKAAMEQYQKDIQAGLAQTSSSPASLASAGKVGAGKTGAGTSSPEASAKASKPNSASIATSGAAAKSSSEAEPSEAGSKSIARDETVGQPGEWETVEPPKPRQESERNPRKDEGGDHYVPGAEDDGGEADPEDLRSFKIEEKIYPVDSAQDEEDQDNGDGSSSVAVFKKRKAGASKPRNIRRKL
ncbi:hypothetical protein B0O80DRAFT_297620 [Mortierella sp. GBAus27b]|nr:hypothetical protein B0O80DRAFT_297620 [Mortierella sp. GBAus27b]